MDNNRLFAKHQDTGRAIAFTLAKDPSLSREQPMALTTEQLDQTVDMLCSRLERLLDSTRASELYSQLALSGESAEKTANRLMMSANSLSELARLMTDAAIRIAHTRHGSLRV